MPDEKLPSSLAAGQVALQHLQQVTPPGLGKGNFRDNEVNGRLKKAAAAITDLERHGATLAAGSKEKKESEQMVELISSKVDSLPVVVESFSKLRGKKVLEFLNTPGFHADLQCALSSDGMDGDTLSSIIKFIGEKLIEAIQKSSERKRQKEIGERGKEQEEVEKRNQLRKRKSKEKELGTQNPPTRAGKNRTQLLPGNEEDA